MSLHGGGGGVGGRVTGRGYAPACAGLEAQDSYELRVTIRRTPRQPDHPIVGVRRVAQCLVAAQAFSVNI